LSFLVPLLAQKERQLMTNQYHLLEGLSDGFITPEKLKRAARSVGI